MHPTSNTNIVGRPPPAQRSHAVTIGGANRGARENLRAFIDFNARSSAAAIVPVYVDPSPGRAAVMKDEAERRGVAAEAVEGRIEDVVLSRDHREPLVLNLDRASAIASVLKATGAHGQPTLGYLLLKLPSGRLWAIRFALQADEVVARAEAVAFFERLASVSERGSSSAVLGEQASPAHVLAEPAIRRWFAEHCVANLAKIAAGIEPVSNAFELSSNGTDTVPLHVVVRDAWSDPEALAREVVENPSAPLRRGVQFVICEVTPAGLRFHDVRRRTDDRITLRGADSIDRESVEARARADALALARAERETVSRRNPVATTD